MAIEVSNHVDIFTPNLFYKSTLTALYSFFESLLREIVKTERERRKVRVRIEDLKGNGITLYRDYLTKVIGIDLITLDKSWDKINNVRQIRNSIVHKDYESPDSEKTKQIIRICNGTEYLEYTGDVNIKNSKYLTDFIDDIYSYLKGLISILRSKTSK